jgi:hypothetical protein
MARGRRRRREVPDRGLRARRAALRRRAVWPVREGNRPLWERMEALGVESGRLGSERAGS